MEQDKQPINKVEKWKALISEARVLYSSMEEEECQACDDWLDEEYVKVEGTDGTLVNVVASNPDHPETKVEA